MATHIVQSPEWGKFKTEYGTAAVIAGGVQFTLHKIPYTSYYFAYCPKVDPLKINWEDLGETLKKARCIAINFDVPNVTRKSSEAEKAESVLKKHCVRSPRNTFAKHNILLDLTREEPELLAKMHHKHRYNLGVSLRKGVTTKLAQTQQDFETFYTLLSQTAARQKYFIHPKSYYQKIWDMLYPFGIVKVLTAYYNNEPLASWMLFVYDKVLYYPYGGSSEKYKNVFASTQVAWESIKLGKQEGCTVFDMWGASSDPDNKDDPWWGFTNFKLRFGGEFVEYIDSYDFVINKPVYSLFNFAQDIRWKVLRTLKQGLLKQGLRRT